MDVADTPAKREMGLQYRTDLADDRGMIFYVPVESQQSFWMKNTPLPLDMIFIDRERKIVGIVEQTVPFSLDSRSVGARASSYWRSTAAWRNATVSKPATACASKAFRPSMLQNKKTGPTGAAFDPVCYES